MDPLQDSVNAILHESVDSAVDNWLSAIRRSIIDAPIRSSGL
jgi:hypothetical protein